MHGHDPFFLDKVSSFLGLYYLVLAGANAYAAVSFWKKMDDQRHLYGWGTLSFLVLILSSFAWSGAEAVQYTGFPVFVQDAVNASSGSCRKAMTWSSGWLTSLALHVESARRGLRRWCGSRRGTASMR